MAMTDYGSLWAPVFGLQWGNVAWVDRYFSGAEVSPPEKLPHLPSGRTGVSWLVALLALAVVVILVAGPFIRGPAMNRDHAVAFLALAAACILAGALYDKIWAFNYYRPRWFYTGFGLVWGAIAAALMFPLWRKKSPGALLLTGTVLFALPTVYKFGSTYASVSALLVVTIGYAIHSRQRATLLWTGAFVALAYTIWNPAVRNFAVRWFSFYSETLASWEVWAFAALLGGAVGAVWKRDPVWLLLCGAGAVVGSGMPFIPAWAYIVPCVLAFPMLMVAWRRPALEAHAVALGLWATPFAMSQTGGDIDLTILPPIAASVALFPLWARAAYKFPLWVRGASILTLSWLSLWTAMGCRLSGINFSFFFLWLPEGMSVEDTWLLNSLISLFKYWVPVGIGLILARRAQPEAVNDVIATIQQFATIKLGLVLAFIVGFSTFQAATAPPFLYSDVLTEAFIWMVLLLFFGCVGVGNIQKTSNNTGVSSP